MTIDERLRRGTVLIIDGGTGTEIQRRGVAMNDAAWCGTAHMSDPDTVRRVHEDYLAAGAEVIIANTFATSRPVLASAGLADRFAEVNRRAVELAVAARATAAAGPAWVAASISSMRPLPERELGGPRPSTEQDYRDQAEILAEAGAELIVAEMMMDARDAAPVVEAAAGVGLPVWIGFSASLTGDGRVVGYEAGEDFAALVAEILPRGGDVAGVMHSDLAATGPALEVLAASWSGPKLAYAETGSFAPPDWVFEETASPEAYAAAAERWVEDGGVQIVGGCCGTGPEHIRALRDRLAGRTVPADA